MDANPQKPPTMLVPRFTILWIMILMAILGIFFKVARSALANEKWAIGITVAVVALWFALAIYALLFLAVAGLARVLSRYSRTLGLDRKPESPFATDRLPPQIIPPVDPD